MDKTVNTINTLSIQQVFDQTPVAICTFNTQLFLLSYNNAAARLFALTEDDLGKEAYSIVLIFQQGFARNKTETTEIKKRLLNGETIVGEYEVKVHDGHVLFLHITTSPLYESGELQGFSVFFQDITAVRNLDRNTTERYQHLKLFYDMASITSHAVLMLDENRILYHWNKGAEQTFHMSTAEALGQNIKAVLPIALEQDELLDITSEKELIKEFSWIKNGGALKYIQMRLTRLRGNPATFIGVCYDVTEAKKSEEGWQEREQALKEQLLEKEEALLLTRQQLHYHLNNTPLGIIEWKGTRITRWSRQATQIFGWTENEAVGKTAEELFLTYENDRSVEAVRKKVFETASVFEYSIIRNRNKAGQPVYCEWYSSVLRNAAGEMVHVLTFVQDITARVSIEEKLASQQQQLSTIYDTVQDVLFMLNVEEGGEYCFASVNRSFLTATGLSLHQIVGRKVSEVIPQPSLDLVLSNYKKAITTQAPVSWEEKTEYPSGIKTGIVTVSPVIDEKGRCTQLVGSVHDITERINLEEEYRKMYELVESSPNYVSIIETDDTGTYHYLNPAGKKLIGIADQPITALNAQKTIGITERNRLRDLMQKRGGQIVEETFFSNQHTGEAIPMLLNAFQIKVGEKSLFACIGLDLREIKKAETELEEANTQLRRLTEHLQEVRDAERLAVAREIHDELGQLLTAIKMGVFWAMANGEKNAAEAKAKLSGAVEMISDTINSVRRIVSDLRPDLLEDLGLVEAIRWHLEKVAAKTGLEVHFTCNTEEIHLPPSTALSVFRICQEALTNVQRHAKATVMDVQLLVTSSSLTLQIADNGIGFDQKETKQKKSFGLQGMRERVAVCGGTLTLHSTLAKGTTILITIPLKSNE